MNFEQVAGVLGKMYGSVKTASDTLSTRKDHKVMKVWAEVYAEFNEWTGSGQPIVDLCMSDKGMWQGAPTRVPGTRLFPQLTMQKETATGYLQISDVLVYSTKLTGTGQPLGAPSLKVPMLVNGSLVVAAHIDLTRSLSDSISLLVKKGRAWPDHVLGKTGEKPVTVAPTALSKHVVHSSSETFLSPVRRAALDRALLGWNGNLRAQGRVVLAWGWRRAQPEFWTEDADEAVRVVTAAHQALTARDSEIAHRVPSAAVATHAVAPRQVQKTMTRAESAPKPTLEVREPVERSEVPAVVTLRRVPRSERTCLQLPVGLKGKLDSWVVADGDRISKNAPIAVMTVWFKPGAQWQADVVSPVRGVIHLRDLGPEVSSRNVVATID